MSPKVLLTFAFQLMMGSSSVSLPPPLTSTSHSLANVWSNATNRQKNRNQLANCTRRCPSPLTLTLTQALLETPVSTVCNSECLLTTSCCCCYFHSLSLLYTASIVVCGPRLVLWTEGCDTVCVWVWTCRRQDHNNWGDCKRNPWLLFEAERAREGRG